MRRRSLVIGVAFVIVVVLSGVALLATVLRTLDADGRPTTVVVASLPFWSLTDDTGIVMAHPGTFTEVSPWVYGLTATGQIAAQAPHRAAETAAAVHRLRRFVTRLGGALHGDNKILSVALFAKTTDAGEDQRNIAQDYAAIGAAVDEVRLMGYDYHWNGSQPGPVAPITWIREVLTYAKTQISPQKVLLGIPVAGYDWVDGRGEEVTWQQCSDRTKAFKATLHYNGEHEAPWFRYTDAQGREHEVWFENADSTKAKLDAVKASGIRGVYLWITAGRTAGRGTSCATSGPPTPHRRPARTWHHANAQPACSTSCRARSWSSRWPSRRSPCCGWRREQFLIKSLR